MPLDFSLWTSALASSEPINNVTDFVACFKQPTSTVGLRSRYLYYMEILLRLGRLDPVTTLIETVKSIESNSPWMQIPLLGLLLRGYCNPNTYLPTTVGQEVHSVHLLVKVVDLLYRNRLPTGVVTSIVQLFVQRGSNLSCSAQVQISSGGTTSTVDVETYLNRLGIVVEEFGLYLVNNSALTPIFICALDDPDLVPVEVDSTVKQAGLRSIRLDQVLACRSSRVLQEINSGLDRWSMFEWRNGVLEAGWLEGWLAYTRVSTCSYDDLNRLIDASLQARRSDEIDLLRCLLSMLTGSVSNGAKLDALQYERLSEIGLTYLAPVMTAYNRPYWIKVCQQKPLPRETPHALLQLATRLNLYGVNFEVPSLEVLCGHLQALASSDIESTTSTYAETRQLELQSLTPSGLGCYNSDRTLINPYEVNRTSLSSYVVDSKLWCFQHTDYSHIIERRTHPITYATLSASFVDQVRVSYSLLRELGLHEQINESYRSALLDLQAFEVVTNDFTQSVIHDVERRSAQLGHSLVSLRSLDSSSLLELVSQTDVPPFHGENLRPDEVYAALCHQLYVSTPFLFERYCSQLISSRSSSRTSASRATRRSKTTDSLIL